MDKVDKNVGALTRAVDLSDDSLFVVEQQGEAKSLEGGQLKEYIKGVAGDFSGGGSTGGSGTMDHSKLMNRSAADQHPASSITFSKGKTEFASETVQGVLEEISHDLANLPSGGGGGGTETNVLRVPGGGDAEIDPTFGGPPYTFGFTPATGEETNSVEAKDVSYSNTATGLASVNVQDAIDELFQSVSDGKALVASAITDKGVPTAPDATFQVMAENILKILGGGTEDMASYEWGGPITGTNLEEVNTSIKFTDVPDCNLILCMSDNPYGAFELCPVGGAFIYYVRVELNADGTKGKSWTKIFFKTSSDSSKPSAYHVGTYQGDIALANGELTFSPFRTLPQGGEQYTVYFSDLYQLNCVVKKA